jgi:hypothetical protein
MSVQKLLKWVVYCPLMILVFTVGGEIATRIDDWLHWGFSPFSPVPTGQEELSFVDGSIRRGRSHGKFKHITLNEYGFRGPEITKEPAPGTHRVMVLGASESFGLRESPKKEYPAQLSSLLKAKANITFEVVNAAQPGLSCPTMTKYWDAYARQFRPTWVIVYPSTHLYIDGSVGGNAKPTDPTPPQDGPTQNSATPGFASRFKSRLRENKPEILRRWQEKKYIESLLSAKPPGWVFETPPGDRLQAVTDDLSRLISAISANGSKPVLLTHALSATNPPRPEDDQHLQAMRGYTLRATPEVLVAFGDEANERIREVARKHSVPCLDVASQLNGRREYFADLVHFNDAGAEKMAQMLADWLIAAETPNQ